MPQPTRCQHVICRANEYRQDLQCTRTTHAKGTRHLHTIALGFCGDRFAHLASADGRKGGHTNPVTN